MEDIRSRDPLKLFIRQCLADVVRIYGEELVSFFNLLLPQLIPSILSRKLPLDRKQFDIFQFGPIRPILRVSLYRNRRKTEKKEEDKQRGRKSRVYISMNNEIGY